MSARPPMFSRTIENEHHGYYSCFGKIPLMDAAIYGEHPAFSRKVTGKIQMFGL